MKQQGLTRRDFLEAAARCGALLGGSCALLSAPGRLLLSLLEGQDGRALAAASTLDELIKAAPVARHWTCRKRSRANPTLTGSTCASPCL